MARKLQSDKWLFLATLALVCVSVVMVYSASAVVALDRYQQPYYFVTRQVMWALLGLAVLSIVMRVDYRTYRNEQVVWAALGLVGALLVAVLFARPINGSRRWFGVGGFGVQPSELAKVAAVLFTAITLDRRMARINDVEYALSPIALIAGALAALILLEPDFGTAAALAAGRRRDGAGGRPQLPLSGRADRGDAAARLPGAGLGRLSLPPAASPSWTRGPTRSATASTSSSRSSRSAAAACSAAG